MPVFEIKAPDGAVSRVPLRKRITSFGSAADCDVVLDDRDVEAIHCQIHFDGRGFYLAPIDDATVFVNGRRKRKHQLSDGETVTVGATELRFVLLDHGEDPLTPAEVANGEAAHPADVAAYERLTAFSNRLLGTYELPELLEELMDAVIAVTGASKGFLVLFEENEPRVRVARNLKSENIDDAIEHLSDSIVAKVVRTKRPLFVSDALNDEEFSSSKSILRLNVSSVMCTPLMDKDSLMGLIYVGSDTIAQLFDDRTLKILTVFTAQASLIVKNALLINELRGDKALLSKRIDKMRFGRIIGSCPAMREVFRKLEKVATTDISVLITGETGTGKELIAAEIHERSSRAKGPFVTINCGAIPENLLESELFGHVKGAFTGAVANKRGKFHVADGGTLFLDEIGELPGQLQVKLLRALQEKTVVRVGDTRPERVDIRFLAATNKDLAEEIKHGRFREDLYYRLNVVNIQLPPLRERGDDVMIIARYLFQRYTEEFSASVKGFSPNASVAIRRYAWPGNIRQLENHIKKAVVLAEKALLSPADLGLTSDDLPPILPLAQAKDEFQRRYINEVLARNSGNRTKTARDLGVDPRTIFRHLEREEELRRTATE
ncbi:MAG: sigma 54-interacting transcriptional regulator [Deltaproteobacteria bacterium]|nr:sigma 54-interacting transcriptional regulator [Deltaproteobacteria bacterium]